MADDGHLQRSVLIGAQHARQCTAVEDVFPSVLVHGDVDRFTPCSPICKDVYNLISVKILISMLSMPRFCVYR